jgi:hypothetical protein
VARGAKAGGRDAADGDGRAAGVGLATPFELERAATGAFPVLLPQPQPMSAS